MSSISLDAVNVSSKTWHLTYVNLGDLNGGKWVQNDVKEWKI